LITKENPNGILGYLDMGPGGLVNLVDRGGDLAWYAERPGLVESAEALGILERIPEHGGNPVAWAIRELKQYWGGFAHTYPLIRPLSPTDDGGGGDDDPAPEQYSRGVMQRIGYVETSNGRLDLVEDNGRLIWTSQNQGLEAKARRLTPTDGRDATTALNAAQRYFGGFTRRLLATEPVDPAAVADTRLWSQWDRQRHNKAEHYARPLKSSPGQLSFGFGGEHQPGETKVENGTTYVFNQNHRWERADQKEMAPQESHAVDPREDYKANGTKAQAFLAWFGNWLKDPANSSQVVDENGEPSHNLEVDSSKVMEDGSPIVMHHGTRTGGFGTFEPRWGQATTDTQNTNGDDLLYGPGHYFTDDKGIAEDYMNIGDDEFTYSPKFDDAETVSRLRSAVISALDRAQNEEAEGNTGPWGIMGGAPGVFDLKQALKDIDEGNYDSSSLSGEKKDQHDWFKGRG